MHPVAFQIAGLTVHWYGILVALGFIAAIWTAGRRGVRYGVSPETVSDVGFWVLVGAIVGAKILFIATYWDEEFTRNPLKMIFNRSGFVFYGGLIGAVVCTIVYGRVKKIALWRVADALAPSIALGHFFGRIGCLMTGCCFGRVCSAPWGLEFPRNSLAWEHQLNSHLINEAANHSLPVHPTQIYEAGLNLVLFLFLAWWYRRKKFDGQIFAGYLLLYALVRSTVEMFRGDYPSYIAGWITPAHLVSVCLFIAGAVLWWWLPRTANPPAAPVEKPRQP